MSQSIYGHIEYKEVRYSYFARVHIESDYTLLALLGGGPREEPKPCFASRGVPTDMNPLTAAAYFLPVTDDGHSLYNRHVTRREAEKWVESGSSIWAGPAHITDPDFLNPSWLLTEEMEQIYRTYLSYDPAHLPLIEATLAAMRSLPESRFVYWFW